MPIYEYRCQECAVKFDKLIRSDSEQAELTCPQCGCKQVDRVPSLFGTSGFSTTPNFTSSSADSCRPSG